MSQNPGQWNPTGGQGYPQQGGQPQGYPAQGGQQPGGYPPQGGQQPGGYPPQGGQQPGGYPTQGGQQPGGYPTQGGYPQQGTPQPGQYSQRPGSGQGGFGQPAGYAAGGYGPQPGQTQVQPPGWGQQPPGTYQPGGRPPTKKSPGLIIGIVAAAVVLLVAVGGIFIALSRGSDEPVSTVTPAPPSSQPTEPTTPPSGQPSEPGQPSGSPSQPSGEVIDLGDGITLTPSGGWRVQDKAASVVSLTNGQGVFYGRQLKVDKSTNAAQFCDAFNRAALKSASNAKFGDAEPRDVGSPKLSAAVCGATYTDTSGDQSLQVFVSSLVSVRKSDGLTVVGTLLFVKSTDDQTKTDASAMMSSMLNSQIS